MWGLWGRTEERLHPPAGSQEVPAPEPEPPPLCPPLFIEGHEATELDRAQFPADPAAASALEAGIGHARAVLPVPEAAEPRFPPRAAHKSINSKLFIIFFFPVSSQKEPGQEEPGQILAKKKRAVAPPRPCAHHRGLAAPAWPQAEAAGTRLPVCVLRAPSSFLCFFFLPKCCAKQPRNAAPASHQQPQPPLQKGQRCTNASPPPRVRFAKPRARTERKTEPGRLHGARPGAFPTGFSPWSRGLSPRR